MSLVHAVLACMGLALMGVAPSVQAQEAGTDPSSASDLAYERQDLVFILDQIEIAEEHGRRGGDCQAFGNHPKCTSPLGPACCRRQLQQPDASW